MKKQKAVWKTIGRVGVDSGTLMVIDPCYAVEFSKTDYKKFVIDRKEKSVEVPFYKGYDGRAVIFNSGCGDSVYEVQAKFEQLQDFGERITEVRIIMK
jgi:hypothetical protein